MATELRKSLTLAELGVIISILLSVGTVIFTGGYLYGQVQSNTVRIDKLEPQMANVDRRLERIDTNVEWIRERYRDGNR